jgi:hypothetical protein
MNIMLHSFFLIAGNVCFFVSLTAALEGCVVTDGANNGTECVFPFIYNNTKYSGCILEANSEFSFEIESWCSTEVDQLGVHVSGKGKWGHCSSKCPLSESEEPEELEEQIAPCTLPNGRKGSCQPYGICGGFGLEDRDEDAFVFDQSGRSVFKNECGQEDESSFVCCPDVVKVEVNIDALKQGFGDPEDELSKVTSLPE